MSWLELLDGKKLHKDKKANKTAEADNDAVSRKRPKHEVSTEPSTIQNEEREPPSKRKKVEEASPFTDAQKKLSVKKVAPAKKAQLLSNTKTSTAKEQAHEKTEVQSDSESFPPPPPAPKAKSSKSSKSIVQQLEGQALDPFNSLGTGQTTGWF